MTSRTTSRAVAFVFSALVTLVTLAGMDRLATQEHAAALWAATQSQTHSA